jgi:hypothetical protein
MTRLLRDLSSECPADKTCGLVVLPASVDEAEVRAEDAFVAWYSTEAEQAAAFAVVDALQQCMYDSDEVQYKLLNTVERFAIVVDEHDDIPYVIWGKHGELEARFQQ